MIIENLCPVCGYEMEAPPMDYRICPSCGTEFGVHVENASIQELQESWIRTGPSWWSVSDPKPEGWDPYTQLAQLQKC
jgi:predicted amidophosphoribosyltransferase